MKVSSVTSLSPAPSLSRAEVFNQWFPVPLPSLVPAPPVGRAGRTPGFSGHSPATSLARCPPCSPGPASPPFRGDCCQRHSAPSRCICALNALQMRRYCPRLSPASGPPARPHSPFLWVSLPVFTSFIRTAGLLLPTLASAPSWPRPVASVLESVFVWLVLESHKLPHFFFFNNSVSLPTIVALHPLQEISLEVFHVKDHLSLSTLSYISSALFLNT